MYTRQQIATALDYAVLKPTASRNDVKDACLLAEQEHFASVCVRPCDVRYALQFGVPISTVIGFPHGGNAMATKALESHNASCEGAVELDIVLNYARILEGNYSYITQELNYIHRQLELKPIIKVILEVCYLKPEHIYGISKLLSTQRFVSFIKTSTGFGSGGATLEAVKIIKEAITGSHLQIKASGGIRTYQDVKTFLDLGCTRIGSAQWENLLP